MIRVLEKNVADKIAAGEVIERPVSIVKELVENSIDAGATSIAVEIKKGGKSYIRVTDNGCGIDSSEAEKAFMRHATSKIETAADLNSIETLGFRGEALASIAAVTRTQLITKTPDSKMGTEIIIHGGEVLSNRGTGCPNGTTFIITDLFYNTPARLKFLKNDGAEGSRIIDFVGQMALAYPKVQFRLINNGNVVFTTNGKGSVLPNILSVYNQREYEGLVPVEYSENGIKITGYVSGTDLTRNNKRHQIFFVNGRVVNSRVIEKGISKGYSERLFDGRHPIAFLFIDVEPAALDVNIHPNKREVRFNDEGLISDAVGRGIESAISTKASVPHIDLQYINKRQPVLDNKDQPEHNDRSEYTYDYVYKDKGSLRVGEQVDIKKLLSTQRAAEQNIEMERQQVVTTEFDMDSPQNKPFDFNDLQVIGVLFSTYIMATENENFYLMDQHAAHERIFYEKLVGEYLRSEKLSQPILTPILIDVEPALTVMESEWLPELNRIGYDIENFGDNTYIAREIPTFMTLSEAESFAGNFINGFGEDLNRNNRIVIDKLITKSCKSAVKANDRLSEGEVINLIEDLKRCNNPFSCPHGRPTFVRISKYEIEKMFKRV